jgi:glycosyltransferase involved in cell wall biosynthesis
MKPRIRVLKCILDSRFGGPHRRSFAIARRLRQEGVETIFLYGYRGSRLEGFDEFEHHYLKRLQGMTRKHPILNFLLFLGFLPANVLRIRRLIKSRQIDIVDVDGVTNPVPALTGRLMGLPVLWCYNDHPPAPVRWFFRFWLARLATRVVVQSERLRQLRTGPWPRLHDKTVVLYPGIDLDRFDPGRCSPAGREQLRSRWNVSGDSPVVGIVGNVNRLKGHNYFVEAACQIKQQVPNARFVVVGRQVDSDPKCWEGLKALIARLGMGPELVLADYQQDIPAVLNAMDVFVLSSTLESCPNVVIEAMAMKIPIVATDVGAVAELLDDGKGGTIVPPHDARAIAEAVLTCLKRSRDEIRSVVDAARKRVETCFDLGRIARLQLDIYEDLVGR